MFFIRHNQVNSGPFTQDEVLSQKLTEDMLVWQEGKPWRKICDVPEFAQAVIKIPPPAPDEEKRETDEFQGTRDRQQQEVISSLKKKQILKILSSTMLIGFVISAVVSGIINELTYSNGWPAYYPIFHTKEENNNHFLTYLPMLIKCLLIVESIVLILTVIKISSFRKGGGFRNSRFFDTDKGRITTIQYGEDLNIADYVLKESNPAPDGTYNIIFSYDYENIDVVGGIVSRVKKKNKVDGIFVARDPL